MVGLLLEEMIFVKGVGQGLAFSYVSDKRASRHLDELKKQFQSSKPEYKEEIATL